MISRRTGKLILVASALALIGCGVYPGTKARLDRAATSAKAGDYLQAALELQTVLKGDPANREALLAIAGVQLNLGDAEAAQSYIRRALEAGGSSAELESLQKDGLLLQGKYTELLEQPVASKDVAGQIRRARALLASGDLPKADSAIADAAAAGATPAQVELLRTQLLIARGQLAEALQAASRSTAADPSLPRAWLIQGELQRQQGAVKEALASFQHATGLPAGNMTASERLQAYRELIELQLFMNDLAGAKANVARVKQSYGNTVTAHLLQGRIDMLTGDAQAAVNEFRVITNARPDDPTMKALLGAALLAQGSREQGMAALNEVIAKNPGDIDSRKLLAQAQLADGRADEARRTLEPVAQGGGAGDAKADWLMGVSLLNSGDPANSLVYLERAAKAAPEDAAIQLQLARAYISANKFAQAHAVLERIPAAKRDAQVRQLQILADMAGRRGPAAVDELRKWATANSSDADALAMAGNYALQIGEGRAATEFLQRAISIDSGHTAALMSLADLALRSNDLPAAERHLQLVIKGDPKNIRALVGLAGIAARNGRATEARTLVERAIAADPSSVEPRLALAQIQFKSGDPAKANDMLDQAVTVASDKPMVANAAGEVAMSVGRAADALLRFEEATRLGFRPAKINVARAQVALGRADTARETLEGIKEQPYALQAGRMLVGMDVAAGNTAQAMKRIASLKALGLAADQAAEAQGDASMAAKDYAAAAKYYQAAYDASPRQGYAVKTYQARRAAADPAPEGILLRWLERAPDDGGAHLLAGMQFQSKDDNKRAIPHYEAVLKVDRDPTILNNLAWAYYKVGDARALQLAQEAYGASSTNIDIADTYGWLLTEQGQAAKAVMILNTAWEHAPSNLTLGYHLAEALGKNGSSDQAVKQLHAVLDSGKPFAERPQAESLLRTLSR